MPIEYSTTGGLGVISTCLCILILSRSVLFLCGCCCQKLTFTQNRIDACLHWNTLGLNERTPSMPMSWLHESSSHYDDVIMTVIASQITSLTIVYTTVYSDADQRKHESSASLAFVWGIHRGPVNSPHKGPLTRKMFPFDDVIMSLSILNEHLSFTKNRFYSFRHFNGEIKYKNAIIFLYLVE